MKLMLRPEWRLWPLSSFLGLLDLKTGVTIALLFALVNKVAGVYGIIAMLTGAGGSFAQLSLYVYSVLSLVALVWGLRVVHEEEPKKTLYFAHFYTIDHIFATSWTIFFAVMWWVWTPHEGGRQSNSPAQQQMVDLANITHHLTPLERKEASLAIWNHEKGLAAAVIILSWCFKIYLAVVIYSYATHLRKGTFRSLPLTRSAYSSHNSGSHIAYDALANAEDDDVEDFYRVPLRSPAATRGGHRRGASAGGAHKPHQSTSSITSFADFVSAPGRPGSSRKKSAGIPRERGIDEEVLFDEDEATYAPSTSSRGHSKPGTESTLTTSDEERTIGG